MSLLQHSDPAGLELVAVVPVSGAIDPAAAGRLFVEDGQRAVVFAGARALAQFGPGEHELPADPTRLAGETVGAPPRVAFVSVAPLTLRWGTTEPVVYADVEIGDVELRGYGTMVVRVETPDTFVATLVGESDVGTTAAFGAHVRDLIVTRLDEVLRRELESVFALAELCEVLALRLGAKVARDLAGHGVVLEELRIGALDPPRSVGRRIEERSGRAPAAGGFPPYSRSGGGAPSDAPEPPPTAPEDAGTRPMPGAPAAVGSARPGACPRCARETVPGASYCAFCGARLDD